MIKNISASNDKETQFRILIIDDSCLVREAIAALLQQQPNFLIIGEAKTGKDGIELAKELKPEIILLDIELPDISGIQVAKRLLNAFSTKIIALSGKVEEFYISKLAKLGVNTYLTKDCSPEELVAAIVRDNQNHLYLSPKVVEKISLAYINPIKNPNSPFKFLTQRELEIVIMICHGEKIAVIAHKLFISTRTVHRHRMSILKKLNIENDFALAKLALEYGIIKA